MQTIPICMFVQLMVRYYYHTHQRHQFDDMGANIPILRTKVQPAVCVPIMLLKKNM